MTDPKDLAAAILGEPTEAQKKFRTEAPERIWKQLQASAKQAMAYPNRREAVEFYVSKFEPAFGLLMEVGTPWGVILEAIEAAMVISLLSLPDQKTIRRLVEQMRTEPGREAVQKRVKELKVAIATVSERMKMVPAKSEHCARQLLPEVRKELGLDPDGDDWPTWPTIRAYL